MQLDIPPSKDTFEVLKLPKAVVIGYYAMYANRMHIWVFTTKEDKIMCNNGVAAYVWQRKRSVGVVSNIDLTRITYVGSVMETLELD
jgi:hypothetical protein